MGKSAPRSSETLARVRELCLSLPGTSEKDSWGHPNFCVAGKIFASYGEYDGRLCVGFKATLVEQARLVRDARFAIAPYVGKHGWVCQWIEQPFAWGELETRVLASYRLIAPKTLLRDLDAALAGAPAQATATTGRKPVRKARRKAVRRS